MNKKKNPLFPGIIAAASLLTLYQVALHPTDIYSMVSVVVGITGVILYYRDHEYYDSFFFAWVFLQIPCIVLSDQFGVETPLISAFPDFVLPVTFTVGIKLGLQHGRELAIDINPIAIGLYFLLRFLVVEKPVGREIILRRQRKGTFPEIEFPVTGTIEKVAGRVKFSAVYQVKLHKEVKIRGKGYNYIMMDSMKKDLVELKDREVCGLRLCDIPDLPFSQGQNPFQDWIIVEPRLERAPEKNSNNRIED